MRRPIFIAKQARAPSGILGRLVAAIMVHETKGVNRRAVDALDVASHDSVLDVGCGSGLSLTLLATSASEGRVAGVDPSRLMVERAIASNQASVDSGQVDISIASVDSLPFSNDSFDKIMTVHTLYFWEDIATAFAEIARVLKPKGRLALIFRTDADKQSMQSFPNEVYQFRSFESVAKSLEAAGFSIDGARSEYSDNRIPALLVAAKLPA